MKIIGMIIFILTFTISGICQWTAVNNGLASTDVTALGVFDNDIIVSTASNGFFRSSDNGDSWTAINNNIGSQNINGFLVGGAGPNNEPFIFAATQSGIFFTTDGGGNWNNNTGTGITNTDIAFYSVASGPTFDVIVGTHGGGLFVSDTLNGPWVGMSNGISGNGMDINGFGGYKDDPLDYYVLATNNGVYYTDDHAANWTAKNNGLSGDALTVNAIIGLQSTFIIATNGGLYLSSDLGETWSAYIPNERFHSIGSLITQTGFTFAFFGEGGYYSTNTGVAPFDMTGVSGGDVLAQTANSQYLFVGTETGGVFRIELTQAFTGIAEDLQNSPNSFELAQNYPNPFNPSTTISYKLEKSVNTRLTIYNTLGQEVRELVNEKQVAGIHQIEWDGRNENGVVSPSGIYFYRLEAGEFVQSRKMILMK